MISNENPSTLDSSNEANQNNSTIVPSQSAKSASLNLQQELNSSSSISFNQSPIESSLTESNLIDLTNDEASSTNTYQPSSQVLMLE